MNENQRKYERKKILTCLSQLFEQEFYYEWEKCVSIAGMSETSCRKFGPTSAAA